MRRLLACVVGVAAALGGAAVHASGGTAAGTDCVALRYIAGINAAAAALNANPPDITAARARVVAVQQDATPEAGVLTPVIEDLNISPPDIEGARTRLQALAAVLALPPGSTCNVDSSPARQTLRDVYASPVFANLDQSSQPSLFTRIVDFIRSVIGTLTRTLGTGGALLLAGAVLAAEGDLLAALAPAAGAFDYAWYSGNAIGSDLWLHAKARCDALRTMVRRRAPGHVA